MPKPVAAPVVAPEADDDAHMKDVTESLPTRVLASSRLPIDPLSRSFSDLRRDPLGRIVMVDLAASAEHGEDTVRLAFTPDGQPIVYADTDERKLDAQRKLQKAKHTYGFSLDQMNEKDFGRMRAEAVERLQLAPASEPEEAESDPRDLPVHSAGVEEDEEPEPEAEDDEPQPENRVETPVHVLPASRGSHRWVAYDPHAKAGEMIFDPSRGRGRIRRRIDAECVEIDAIDGTASGDSES